ncbi:hypothetical protein [Haloferula rosea]|uniref:Uncharacterized protein n=1 Tax=Haloferula rosea TaxID=490093 RepID=A0A934RER0_9BACT|nr:hypothetical protein [Haloferula rosea]MBK1827771.1 hypothetical protein [Haloferula rosea]
MIQPLILLAVLLVGSLLHAAEPNVRFLAERVPKELGSVSMFAEEARSEPFSLPTNHLSQAQPAPGRRFVLRPEGKEMTVAKVALPEDGKSFIVLLLPSRKAGYETVVIRDDAPNFRPGDVYVHNNASKTVLGYVGSTKFTIAPAQGKSIRPEGARDEGFYDVGFGVREKAGDRALSKTRWPVEEQIRSYVFFFMNPETQRVDFRAVDEFVAPEKPGA